MKRTRVVVNDLMQQDYVYYLTEPVGKNFAPEFHPDLTPKQMLALGVFGGRYMTDCTDEFPADWFTRAKLCPERVPVVLPLLHGPPLPRRRTADQTLAANRAACRPGEKELPQRRPPMPPTTTPGIAALGVRFAENVIVKFRSQK
jgi:hypothetical protein